jgi:hypothetical protein
MRRLRTLSSISIGLLGFVSTGLGISCSSDHGRSHAPPGDNVAQTGSLNLALTARGESGALYRLRDAFFQVNDPNFNFFTQLFTENDPTASTLETTMPVGDFAITLFAGFSLERIDPDGGTSRVASTLVSPSTQAFHINSNEQTNVAYRFETNGEIVDFGQGRLVVDLEVTERAGQSRRTVIETNQTALSSISLRGTLGAALANGGIASVGATDVYHALIDSYNQAPGRDSSLRHCDDQSTDGQPSLNGFPLACPRLEGQLFDNLDSWFPIAFVNRLDLAPADGSNCGQQRIIFANDDGGRMFIILEAQIPNPSPECGVSACLPLAELWDSLATVDDPAERGQRLADAFLVTGTGPIAPFMNARHLGPEGGQIRTNNFNDFQWTLREFQMQAPPNVLPLPVSVGEAPNGELWDDNSGQPRGEECRQSFLEALPNLLSDNLATLGFPVAEACEDAESPNDFFRQDYASHLSFGTGSFQSAIDEAVAGTGLSANDVANRARFAGSCMGCHIESSGAFLGRVSAPFSSDFVHVSELATERCDGAGTCFGISEALRTVFLPHRVNVQRNLIEAGLTCGAAPEPGADAGVGSGGSGGSSGGVVGVGDAGVAVASAAGGGPLRTLGGQPVVEHPH